MARAAKLQADQRVRVTVEGDSVIISPYVADSQSLESRLARFDIARHGGEAMAATPLGAERW